MNGSETREPGATGRWRRASELPPEVFDALRKANRAINPIAVVATVDPDGTPRTAPFGSLRAITPGLLRLCCAHRHDTYANLCRDGRAMVALLAPPDIAVGIRGRARLVREQMNLDEHMAVLEIDVEEVKNDTVRGGAISSAAELFVIGSYGEYYVAACAEVEDMA